MTMLTQGNHMYGIGTKWKHSREVWGKYQLVLLYVMVHGEAAIALKKKNQNVIRDHLFRAEITSLQIRWTEKLNGETQLGCIERSQGTWQFNGKDRTQILISWTTISN